jgi:N-acetylmuramoyl-L-alanine amidase
MIAVVIDPGHGGSKKVDGSSPNNATGPTGLEEKTVTLQVGLAAARALAKSGAKVLLTRKADRNIGVIERAAIAKKSRALAFVSIHFNASEPDQRPAQGTETWIGEGYSQVSRALADRVHASVRAVTGHRNGGVKVGNVSAVIKPANHDPQTANCLIEISFLDRQPEEELRLRDPAYIEALGRAVADGILAHLRERDLLPGVDGVAFMNDPKRRSLADLADPGHVDDPTATLPER